MAQNANVLRDLMHTFNTSVQQKVSSFTAKRNTTALAWLNQVLQKRTKQLQSDN